MYDTKPTKKYYVVYFMLAALNISDLRAIPGTAGRLACNCWSGNCGSQSRIDRCILHAHFDQRSAAVAGTHCGYSVDVNSPRSHADGLFDASSPKLLALCPSPYDWLATCKPSKGMARSLRCKSANVGLMTHFSTQKSSAT